MAKLVKCTNCSGTGRVNHFAHIDNGICYACNGTGKVKANAENAGTNMNAAHHILDTLFEQGIFNRAQFDANWEWCMRKNSEGMDSAEILASVERSAKKNRGW
jgi:DnaJ-class molecular chaperone